MKHKHFSKPQSGKLVRQLPRGVSFVYDLCFGDSRYCWKSVTKEHNI